MTQDNHEEHVDSHLRVLKRFANFWSNVSKLRVAQEVPHDTQVALVRGMERAYGKEEQGREA